MNVDTNKNMNENMNVNAHADTNINANNGCECEYGSTTADYRPANRDHEPETTRIAWQRFHPHLHHAAGGGSAAPPPARPSRFRSIRGALCTRRLAAGLQASDHLKGAAAGRRHQPGKPEQHQAGQA